MAVTAAPSRTRGVSAEELTRRGLVPPPLLARSPAKLAWHPGLDMTAVAALFAAPHTFFEVCQGTRDDGSVGYYTATPTQREALAFVHDHRWTDLKKGRQAKITTAMSLGVILRDCMYLEGTQGVIIANTRETAEMVFRRISDAYERLPDGTNDPLNIKMPLARGRRPAAKHIRFCHGGSITVLTMGAKAPAVGWSIDRLLVTEFGESQCQEAVATNLFPTVAKRPNAMVILEGTPGLAGSHDEKMWHAALREKGRFSALFLPWYEEAANRTDGVWGDDRVRLETALVELAETEGEEEIDDLLRTDEPAPIDIVDRLVRTKLGDLPERVRRALADTVLTSEERAYAALVPNATLLHLLFRRQAIDTEFAGDPRLFSAEYPKDPYDGWLGSKHPVLPGEVIRAMLASAKPDGAFPLGPGGCYEIHRPVPGAIYLETGDPAHYGDAGDPSALAVWRVRRSRTLQLVAFWQGREDPGRFAARMLQVQERYPSFVLVAQGDVQVLQRDATMIAVESNAAACIQAILDADAEGVYWCERTKPGWFATDTRIMRGETRAVALLRAGEAEIAAEAMLQQLLDYDGSKRAKRGTTSDGLRHHFDLARTFLIAADIVHATYFPDAEMDARASPRETGGEGETADIVPNPAERPGVTWAAYDQDRKARQRGRKGAPLGPGIYAQPEGLYS